MVSSKTSAASTYIISNFIIRIKNLVQFLISSLAVLGLMIVGRQSTAQYGIKYNHGVTLIVELVEEGKQ